MNTLDVLEKYSRVCGDLDAFMNEENRLLRNREGLDESVLTRKRDLATYLENALRDLRDADPANTTDRTAMRELRDRLVQKLLKLLLLSRESEQLILKNSMAPAQPVSFKPSATRLKSAYQVHTA